ncbi:hypothetical protein WJX74_000118 [Apatococcus lobatus]|uniref:Uncharacterized protein n=1 Tax=Apatococcus lobatus TaxID=904363 RepID=A0AAW1QLC1_9CHLO
MSHVTHDDAVTVLTLCNVTPVKRAEAPSNQTEALPVPIHFLQQPGRQHLCGSGAQPAQESCSTTRVNTSLGVFRGHSLAIDRGLLRL